MNALRASFGFLTILPIAPGSGSGLGAARAYFPLVGLVLGAAMAGFDRVSQGTLGTELTSALIVVGLLAATRMLHIDGLMDSCDALLGGYTRERRREILKDPRVGAFGAIGGASVLFLKWTALVTLAGPARLPVIVLFPVLSRWSAVVAMQAFSYGQNAGTGTALMEVRGTWPPLLAAAIALASSALIAGPLGVLLMIVATLVAILLGAWMAGLLGGLAGDSYGAIVETTEVVTLIAAVALFHHWPELLDGRVGWVF